MQQLVFTFVGNDKPGLVQRLSEHVAMHGGNWLESRLARMAGKFAGIVSVSVPYEQVASLSQALQQLSDEGLSLVVEHTDGTASQDTRAGRISVLGNDRPGIVREIAAALASRSINIEELSSKVESAPMAGIPLFSANIHVAMPGNLDLDELQEQLDDIANQLDLDISLDITVANEAL